MMIESRAIEILKRRLEFLHSNIVSRESDYGDGRICFHGREEFGAIRFALIMLGVPREALLKAPDRPKSY
jgi:hypothetical protein